MSQRGYKYGVWCDGHIHAEICMQIPQEDEADVDFVLAKHCTVTRYLCITGWGEFHNITIFSVTFLIPGRYCQTPHFQPPPGLGGVQQSVQALSWRNANCGGSYTGEVFICLILKI